MAAAVLGGNCDGRLYQVEKLHESKKYLTLVSIFQNVHLEAVTQKRI